MTNAPTARRSGELTQDRLKRFGGAIVAMILLSLGIAMWSLRSAADSTTETREGADAIAAMDNLSLIHI